MSQLVYLYHCRNDDEIPYAIAEKTAAYLKNAKMFVRDMGGHMSQELMMDMLGMIMQIYA